MPDRPTIRFALLLHFYQPPGQIPSVLRRIVNESYRPLLRVFNERAGARATFNMNAVLTEMLDDHGYQDVIRGLSGLAGTARIEFTGSGKFHPILPLIPPAEAARQITLNDETNRRLLGGAYSPRGFFPPEMSWDHAIAPIVAGAGFEWAVMSGIACPTAWPLAQVAREPVAGGPLALLFRDDLLSNKIAFRTVDARGFLSDLRALASPDEPRYVVIAMDAETFGHHIPRWEEDFLSTLYRLIETQPASSSEPQVIPCTISDVVAAMPAGPSVVPHTSSWSTTQGDLDSGSPFPLWKHRGNEIHRLQWRHLEQAMALFSLAEANGNGGTHDENLRSARAFADMALHSDQFWWASRRPHWSVNLVHRGLSMQRDVILNAVRAINLSDAPDDVRRDSQERVAIARDLADRLTDRLFWD